jgi:hypothetical protein
MHRNIQHLLDKSPGRFAQVTFSGFPVKQFSRNVLRDITGPSLGGVKSYYPDGVWVVAAVDIAENRFFVGFRFISFDIGATKPKSLSTMYTVTSLVCWSGASDGVRIRMTQHLECSVYSTE